MKWDSFVEKDTNTHDYWMSYSDLMAGLILILILYLVVSAANYNESAVELEEVQDKYNEQQEKVEALIGIRSEIIETLTDAFSETDMRIEVDEKTGAITLESGILFDVNKSYIKKKGRDFLDEFMPIYLNVLLKKEYSEYIGEIIIEGHTDTNGTYAHNLELSQARAFEVSKYITSDKFKSIDDDTRDLLKSIMTANGRSFSNPILDEDGSVNLEESRRVEFKFRLRDREMIEEMQYILSKEVS
jgi:chemotaxis protein MotB